MTRSESSVIFTHSTAQKQVATCYRLIRTIDAFHGEDVFSVFLTTYTSGKLDEEFVYDISRKESVAKYIFTLLCKEHVTACTLQDTIHDFLAEGDIF